MNQQQAIAIALAHARRYDFDQRIVIDFHRVDSEGVRQQISVPNSLPTDTKSAGESYEVVIRLYCSEDKIQSLIELNDGKVEIEQKRHFLGKGSALKLTVCSSGVVQEKWLGVQFS